VISGEINQSQMGHHAGLGEGVQRLSFGTIQLNASRRRSQQNSDDAVLASIAAHLASVAIHDHVGLPSHS
jgi:hypothetical protein